MPRTEESNQRIREEQKRKIIGAATKVFAYKGLAATKMSDIATEAGMSYGLLYHYFDNKELIFRACVEDGTLAFARLISRMTMQEGSPWNRVLQLTTIILDGIKRVPESFLVANHAFMSDAVPQDIREIAQRQSREGMRAFEELIAQGQKLGEFVAGNPSELTLLYFACIGGVAQDLAYLGIPDEHYPHPETLLRLLKA